jgi:hypothetical protein
MQKSRVVGFISISILLGIILAFSSQYIWKNQTQSRTSPSSQVCAGPNDATADGVDACGLPSMTTAFKGFPIKYYKVTTITTYQPCDGACAQTQTVKTHTNNFRVISFMLSWLIWSAVAFILIYLVTFLIVLLKNKR